MSSLLAEVRALLAGAAEAFAGTDVAAAVRVLQERLDEPVRVAFAGRVKAGKSTLLNALVGEELAATDAGECTRVVTWYRDGHTPKVTMHLRDGGTEPARYQRDEGSLQIDLGSHQADDVDRLDVQWPSRQLAEMTLIDTPGLGSAHEEVSASTQRFLAIGDETGATEADAVVYLLRHLHQSDLAFLEAFHDGALGPANPTTTIAVLSRADEIGACRPEAMQTARRIAYRYHEDPRVRRLSQTVLPVAGLLAQAAVTLTEGEYRSLRALAELSPAEADELLLTVDRFVADGAAASVALTPAEREGLLARLGLYGVRTSMRLIRLGAATTSSELAERLREVSGIDELRRLLTTLFAERSDVLKARAALAALDALLREHGDARTEHLAGELERVVASAHELVEAQVLTAVRGGLVPLRPVEAEEVDRLLGQPGATLAEKLAVEPGQERAGILAAIERWRARAESPISSRATVEVAAAVVRTLEGALARMDGPPAR
jgi:predicted GTPase